MKIDPTKSYALSHWIFKTSIFIFRSCLMLLDNLLRFLVLAANVALHRISKLINY